MFKTIKKISAFLLMVAMMLTGMSVMTFAAEGDEEKTAVYVQVPDDWNNPSVWAWDEDGNNAFDSWPGEEMDQDAANEGWYYVWIPNWATHVIISANESGIQTDEVVLEGTDAWVTVNAADSVDVSYDKQTTGDTPEYVEKFAIHAKVDDAWSQPSLWAWSAPDGTNAFDSWPGKTMTEDENGWFAAKAPVWVNSVIINANEGGVQTEDISIDASEVWITVEADGTYDFSYNDPDKADVANVTVRVMAPSDWSEPCLWAWSAPDGTNVYTTWPGEALEEDENGWLKKEIPGWVNSIIVNGNEGGVQTTDISVDTEKDVWIIVNGPEDFEISYEEPAVDSAVVTADAATETTEVMTEQNTTEDSNSMVPIVVIIIIIAAIAVVTVIVVKKKSASK